MDFKWIGWLVSIFLGFTLIMNVMSGASLVTTQDRDKLDQQKMTQSVDIGIFSLAIPGSGYVKGIIELLDFKEYNDVLFTGNAQIIYFFLTGVSFMVLFFIFVTLVSLAVNAIRGR